MDVKYNGLSINGSPALIDIKSLPQVQFIFVSWMFLIKTSSSTYWWCWAGNFQTCSHAEPQGSILGHLHFTDTFTQGDEGGISLELISCRDTTASGSGTDTQVQQKATITLPIPQKDHQGLTVKCKGPDGSDLTCEVGSFGSINLRVHISENNLICLYALLVCLGIAFVRE